MDFRTFFRPTSARETRRRIPGSTRGVPLHKRGAAWVWGGWTRVWTFVIQGRWNPSVELHGCASCLLIACLQANNLNLEKLSRARNSAWNKIYTLHFCQLNFLALKVFFTKSTNLLISYINISKIIIFVLTLEGIREF